MRKPKLSALLRRKSGFEKRTAPPPTPKLKRKPSRASRRTGEYRRCSHGLADPFSPLRSSVRPHASSTASCRASRCSFTVAAYTPSVRMFRNRSAQREPVLAVTTTPPCTTGPPGPGCADTDADAPACGALTSARGAELGAGAASSARAAAEVASTKERARTAVRLTVSRPSGRLPGHPGRIIRSVAGGHVQGSTQFSPRVAPPAPSKQTYLSGASGDGRAGGGARSSELPAPGGDLLTARVADAEGNPGPRQHVQERGARLARGSAETAHFAVHVDQIELHQAWVEQARQGVRV